MGVPEPQVDRCDEHLRGDSETRGLDLEDISGAIQWLHGPQ